MMMNYILSVLVHMPICSICNNHYPSLPDFPDFKSGNSHQYCCKRQQASHLLFPTYGVCIVPCCRPAWSWNGVYAEGASVYDSVLRVTRMQRADCPDYPKPEKRFHTNAVFIWGSGFTQKWVKPLSMQVYCPIPKIFLWTQPRKDGTKGGRFKYQLMISTITELLRF